MMTAVKPSGVEGFGDIPENWDVNKMAYTFSFGKGLSITKEDLQDEGIPSITYGDIHSRYGFQINPEVDEVRCVDPRYLKTARNSLLQYGDFIFADTSEDIAGSGNFTLMNSHAPAFAGYHTITARAKREVDVRFIAYLFDSEPFRNQIRNSVSGVKVFSVTQTIIKGAKLLLPPITEQRAIAAILDDRCGQIDGIIADLERQVEILRKYKNSLITETLTANHPHWIKGRVKDLMTLQRGYDLAQDEFVEGIVPVYGSNGIVGYHNKITTLSPGITIGRSGSVGEVNFVNEDFWAHNTSIFVKNAKGNRMKFLYYVLLSFDIKELSSGSAVPTLDRKNVESVHLTFPTSLDEQQIMADFLDTKCAEIDTLITEKQRSIEIMRQYKRSLIYEYVTGKKRVAH